MRNATGQSDFDRDAAGRGGAGLVLFAALLVLNAALAPPAEGQHLLRNLRILGRDAGRQYMEPASSSFGAAMNTGWFQRAPDRTNLGLDIGFGLAAVGGLFRGAPRHFQSSGDFSFNGLQALLVIDSLFGALQQNPRLASLSQAQRDAVRDTLVSRISGADLQVSFRGPTAVGPKDDSLYIDFQGISVPITLPAAQPGDPPFDTTVAIAPGRISTPMSGALEALPFLPLLAPSLTLGTAFGTQATIRWFPKTKLSDGVGAVGLFGYGVQHNLAYWLGPDFPADLTLDYHGQRLEVEDTFTASSHSAGAIVSWTFGHRRLGITPFAGAALERSSIDADFDLVIERPAGDLRRNVKFSLDGKNDTHITLGLALSFLVFNLAADYNFAEYDTFSAGIGVML